MSNLQPKQFTPWYHTSHADLTPGDSILPANHPDNPSGANYDYTSFAEGPDRGDWAFAADTEMEAQLWAPSGRGRQTTYEVDAQSQPYHEFEDQHVEVSEQHIKVPGPMPITRRIDIPKPWDKESSVQGTLPPIDWSDYRRTGFRHMTDDQLSVDPEQTGINAEENHDDIHHPTVRAHRERKEKEVPVEKTEQAVYEQRWKNAGQLHLFHGPTASGRTVDMTNRYRHTL